MSDLKIGGGNGNPTRFLSRPSSSYYMFSSIV